MEKKYFDTSFANNTFEKVNEEFLKCTVAVCSHEQIANGTKFTKEALNNALPTLNYLPTIGYFKDGDFSDHGIELVIDNEGLHEVVKTIPFGVVIKDSYRYENLTKDNGETEEYLVCDVYLWSRYEDAINVVKNNQCNQSMEINVLNASLKENYYEITECSFSALCILGSDVTPAFKLAKIRTSDKFSKDDFKTNYTEMIGALDKFLDFEEGGKKVKERDKIIDKYSYLKSEEYTKIIKNTELSNEELEKQLFSLSVNDLERKIREKLRETVVKTVDYWGDEYEYQKYYLEDILVEENIVICEDTESWYKYFGIPYSINGDEVVLDIENAKRYVRGDWREFVEGDKELSGQAFSEMSEIIKNKAISLKEQFDKANEELQDVKSKYADLQSDFSKVQKDNQELAKFKADIDKQVKDKEIEEELKPFEALAELDEYKEIYARRYELSLDKLVKEMKVLAFDNGKLISKQGKKKFEKETIKVPVIEKDLNIPKVDKAWSILDKHIK